MAGVLITLIIAMAIGINEHAKRKHELHLERLKLEKQRIDMVTKYNPSTWTSLTTTPEPPRGRVATKPSKPKGPSGGQQRAENAPKPSVSEKPPKPPPPDRPPSCGFVHEG